jgi:hypothetical protein
MAWGVIVRCVLLLLVVYDPPYGWVWHWAYSRSPHRASARLGSLSVSTCAVSVGKWVCNISWGVVSVYLHVCTVQWLGVNVLFSWVFLVRVRVGWLCRVEKCLNISVGHKVYLSWVHVCTVYQANVYCHHRLCIGHCITVHWVFTVVHSGRLLGFPVLYISVIHRKRRKN